jgi:hypothetical protein
VLLYVEQSLHCVQALRYQTGNFNSIVTARHAAPSLMRGFKGCSATVAANGCGRNAHVVVTKTAAAHTALVSKHAAELQQIKQLQVPLLSKLTNDCNRMQAHVQTQAHC